jgi:hypothetical protein
MNTVPVRFRDRWIDDGAPLELWSDDGAAGLSLDVASTSAVDPGLAAMAIRRIGDGAIRSSVVLVLDVRTGEEIRAELGTGDVLAPPLDRAWLQAKLDPDLRAALGQRLERQPRALDIYDWKEGDRPRVSLGDRATFAQVLPAAWDLVTRHGGRRYALIDSYRIDQRADEKPVAVELVDLEAREVVGHAEIYLDRDPTRTRGPMWRCSGPIADPLLMSLRQDADRWFELVDRAETIARIARVMARWERDLRDPAAVARHLLAGWWDRDELLLDRVRSLGDRCVPALGTALLAADDADAVAAACALAELGDAAGLDVLVSALTDPGTDAACEPWELVEALACLGERAVDALLAAIASGPDREARDRLLDALGELDVKDPRIRDLLLEAVRAEPRRAMLLADYGDDDPDVIAVLAELARDRFRAVEADPEAVDAFDEAAELVQALCKLDAACEEIGQFEAITERRRLARRAARRAAPETARSRSSRAAGPERPGRNESCWCGSNRKYKKCHLDADAEARRSP